MYPENPFDEIWESQKDKLKAKKIKLRWKTTIQKVKPRIPERLSGIKEIWRYYFNHSSFHGLHYWLDKQLHPFERIIWVLTFFIGFGWAIKIIFEIYTDFQLKKSNIIIDEINTHIVKVPFPSITVCPNTRVDWVKAVQIADALVPKGNEKAKQYFLELLDISADIRLSSLHELKLNTNDSAVLQILNDINMTQVMLDVLPECETFIFNCSWHFTNISCCDIFDLQRSFFGFCYSFNSLTSEKSKDTFSRAHDYGLRSGLRFSTVMTNRSRLPPSMKTLDYQRTMPIMISDVHVTPLKSRYFAFGHSYYVSLKFTCGYASDEILALEKEPQPPCRHDQGHYKYQNCLMSCWQNIFQNKCECNPSLIFKQSVNVHSRPCNISEIACISDVSTGKDPLKGLFNEEDFFTKNGCECSSECEYINYDDYTGAVPLKSEDKILIDIHFDGPTGVCYKRVIVLSNLSMLVQFGGIFGLFVGGSLISCAELLYNILITIAHTVCCKFSYFKKKEKIKIHPVIEVNSLDGNALKISRKNNDHIFRNNYFVQRV